MLNATSKLFPVYALSLAAALMNAGCLAENIDADASYADEEEDLGTAQSALCSDTSLASDAKDSLSFPGAYDVGTSGYGASPSATYGTSACAGRFVLDASNTTSQPNLSASVAWENNGLSQATCSQGRANMQVFGWNGSSWQQIGGEVTGSGVWSPTFGGFFCSVGVGVSVPNTFSKIRVAGKAFRVNGSTTPQIVTDYVSAHH